MFCTMQTYSTLLTLVIVTSLFLFTTQGSSSNAVEPTKKPLKLANYRATCEDRTRTLVTRLNTSHHSVVWQRYDIYNRYMRRMPPLCIITDAYKETTRQGGATFTCTILRLKIRESTSCRISIPAMSRLSTSSSTHVASAELWKRVDAFIRDQGELWLRIPKRQTEQLSRI